MQSWITIITDPYMAIGLGCMVAGYAGAIGLLLWDFRRQS